MNTSEFKKLVKEELKKAMSEMNNPEEETKNSLISQIYQWIIKGDMKSAQQAMQNDPELLKLANNVEVLKKELLHRMAKDEKMLELVYNAIQDIKKRKGID